MNFPVDDSQWSCVNGGSLIFDGSDDYVSLPTESDYDFTSAVTVAAWVKVTSFSVAEQAIVTKGDSTWRLERNASTDALQFSVDGLTTNTVVQGSVSVNDGNWHHVAGVYDGSELLLYVDGVEDNAVTATGTMDTNNAAVYFGANAGVGGRYFDGRMNDVYIYDTALSPGSIQTLAATSLLAWWKLDESSGTTVNDSTANGYDGAISGNPVWQPSGGQIDGALLFDGSGDQIEDTDAENYLNGLTACTVAVWVKSDVTNVDKGIFITKDPDGSDDILAMRYDQVGSSSGGAEVIKFSIATTSGDKSYESSALVQTTSWQLLAITWASGETPKLYINGTLDILGADSGSIGGSITGVTKLLVGIGAKSGNWDGKIDDFRIYDRALCAAEIAAFYQLLLADHVAGQETGAFTGSGSNVPAELFGFNLDPGPATLSVTELFFKITSIVGLTDGDWANIDLVVDDDNNGDLEVTEITLVGGIGVVDQAAETVTFSTSFNVSAVTNYILRADFGSLSDGDTVTIVLNPSDITTTAAVGGSTTAVVHSESAATGGFTWLVTPSDISLGSTGWQDIDLSTLVPAGATGVVVEIANTDSSVRRGVLRGKEDTREYMFDTSWNAISELCHRYQIVKLDSNRFIEGYINNTSVDFRLIGYTSGSDPSYFASPPQISPTAGGWTTVDVSAQVDADADGVILFIQNQDSANNVYGMRELTSGDIALSMRNHRSRMHVVGLDAAKTFKAYIESTGVKIYLVGQTKGSVVYYTNNVAVTDPTTGSWQPRDADNYGVAAEADGLFLSVWNSGSVTDISFRHGDSSDNFAERKLNGNKGFQAAAGLNAANEWGEYMGTTNVDVYIAGYTNLTSSASAPKIVSWREVDPN